jgi:hypothetical protein
MPCSAPRLTFAALAVLVGLAAVACEQEPGETCPAVTIKFPDGKDLGFQCAKDEDCKYGLCYKGSITSFATDFGVCTKRCDCGENSDCSLEGTYPQSIEAYFVCQRPSISSQPEGQKDTLTAFCMAQCLHGVDECDRYGDFYTDCDYPETGLTTRTLCLVK